MGTAPLVFEAEQGRGSVTSPEVASPEMTGSCITESCIIGTKNERDINSCFFIQEL
jgi:hypothetical protein